MHAGAQPASLRLTPEIGALLGAGFCNAVAHGALYAFLSLHLEREGYSGTTIGMLWTLGVAAEIVVFLYLPQLFRRYALSTLLVASLGCGVLRFARHRLGGRGALDSPDGAVAARRHFRLVPCRRRCRGASRVSRSRRKPAARRCFPA